MIQDPETVVNAIGPLSILVPQYQDSAVTAAVNAMGPVRTLAPQSSEACEHIDITGAQDCDGNGASEHVDSTRQ